MDENRNPEFVLLNLTLFMPETWGKFRRDVPTELFVDPEARLIAEAMHYLIDEAGSLSFGVLNLRLQELDLIGNGVSLETVVSMIQPKDMMDSHIWQQYLDAIVKNRQRAMFDTFMFRMARAQADPEYTENPDKLFALGITELQNMQKFGQPDDFLEWRESFKLFWEIDRERTEQEKQGPSIYQWPWHTWNRHIDPLEPSSVVQIAGGTGVGKTVFAECLADYWASRGATVVFFHLELSKKMMLDRRTCRWAKLDRRKLLYPSSRSEDENRRLADTERRILSWPGSIHYQPCAGWHIDKIRARAEELQGGLGADVVIVDHMKKIQASPRQVRLKMDTLTRQGDDVEQMKILAEHEMRVVLLNQLRKSGREQPLSQMTENDIEGSAQQSNLVNVVVLIDRPTLAEGRTSPLGEVIVPPGSRDTITQVKVVKNTMGSHGSWNMVMKPEHFVLFDMKEESNGR